MQNLRMFTCVYVSLCIPVVHNTAQNNCDIFPPNCQTIIIALMLSIQGEGVIR